MKKLILACILLAVVATACDTSMDDINVTAPEVENTDNGDQPHEPDPDDKPGATFN